MESKRKAFFISPVRQMPSSDVQQRICAYVRNLETQGYAVHWPIRDTKQDDSIGLNICLQNARAIRDADEVHIWYDPASQGSIFDLGATIMTSLVIGPAKMFVIANPDEVLPTPDKSFPNILLALAAGSTESC